MMQRVWVRDFLAAALLATALAPIGARAQDERVAEPSHLVRVYLVDRRDRLPMNGDVAASLTLRYRSGRGETILLPRIAPEARGSGESDAKIGALRGFVGSRGMAELFWRSDTSSGSGAAAPRTRPEASPPSEAAKSAAPSPDPRDVLRRAHQGPFFAASIPASKLSRVASAWVTLRRGDQTWTTEEFQGPSVPKPTDEESLAGVENRLNILRQRADAGTTFMMVRPQAQLLLRDLAALAPYGFLDGTGAFEDRRQSCLAIARAIDDACSAGDWGRLSRLTLECRPVVQGMKELHPAPPRPNVPTLDHEP
jgi:hypothetical protein